MDEPVPDEVFSAIVDREIEGTATPDDTAYLWSSIDIVRRWRALLRVKVAQAKGRITTLTFELNYRREYYLALVENDAISQREWACYEQEQAEKIRKARIFTIHMDARLAEMKEWLRQQTMPGAQGPALELNFARTLRTGYSMAWKEAIDRIKFLIGNGLSFQQAYDVCAHHHKKLVAWKISDDPHAKKPRLPIPRDGWGVPLGAFRAYDQEVHDER